MARDYRMRKRADARDLTRERIVQATMRLHDEKGVAPTTIADVARGAGVGQATVYRHFPTINDLVRACGMHVWLEMRPPVAETAAEIFAGVATDRERLLRLIEELDAFYGRGELRLRLAGRDRELLPELDAFLSAVEAGIAALVNEALAGDPERERAVPVVIALTSFPVWQQFQLAGLAGAESAETRARIVECAIRATRGS